MGSENLDAIRAALEGTERLASSAELRAHYDAAFERAIAKEVPQLTPEYQAFIERAPFMIVASIGPSGIDCSPRGDQPGFVHVLDSRTLLFADRRGNNRLDTLENLVEDPRISLIFMIPGVGETLRVKGVCEVRHSDQLNELLAEQGKPARSVIVVHIQRVYFQCQKSLARSRLWDGASQAAKGEVPTAGQMLQSIIGAEFDGASYDADYPEHLKKTIY